MPTNQTPDSREERPAPSAISRNTGSPRLFGALARTPERVDEIFGYEAEADEIVVHGRYDAIAEMLESIRTLSAIQDEGAESGVSIVYFNRKGGYRFPIDFVLSHDSTSLPKKDSEYDRFRILESVERHLPGKYQRMDGALELIREYDSGMIERLGWEDAIRQAFRPDETGRVGLGEFRALVFSIYLKSYKPNDTGLIFLENAEANTRKAIRRALDDGKSQPPLPSPIPGTFRLFRDRFADIRTTPTESAPAGLPHPNEDGSDIVLDLFAGDLAKGLPIRAEEIFRLYPEAKRVIASLNGTGYEFLRTDA